MSLRALYWGPSFSPLYLTSQLLYFNISLQQYADDTQLFFSATGNTLQSSLQLRALPRHTLLLVLALMVISLKQLLLVLAIAGTIVPISDLGITLHNHLTLNNHISTVLFSLALNMQTYSSMACLNPTSKAKVNSNFFNTHCSQAPPTHVSFFDSHCSQEPPTHVLFSNLHCSQAPPTHIFKRFAFRTSLVTHPSSYQY